MQRVSLMLAVMLLNGACARQPAPIEPPSAQAIAQCHRDPRFAAAEALRVRAALEAERGTLKAASATLDQGLEQVFPLNWSAAQEAARGLILDDSELYLGAARDIERRGDVRTAVKMKTSLLSGALADYERFGFGNCWEARDRRLFSAH